MLRICIILEVPFACVCFVPSQLWRCKIKELKKRIYEMHLGVEGAPSACQVCVYRMWGESGAKMHTLYQEICELCYKRCMYALHWVTLSGIELHWYVCVAWVAKTFSWSSCWSFEGTVCKWISLTFRTYIHTGMISYQSFLILSTLMHLVLWYEVLIEDWIVCLKIQITHNSIYLHAAIKRYYVDVEDTNGNIDEIKGNEE